MEHDRDRWRTLQSKDEEIPNSTTTGSPEADPDHSPEPLHYPVPNPRSSEDWEPGPEPSQTLATNPEPIPSPQTIRKRRKNLEDNNQTMETQLRRSKRTRKTTEKAEGDEFKNYIHSYKRKERQERKCARGRGAIMMSRICSFVAKVVHDDENGGWKQEEPPWIGQEVISQEPEEMRNDDQLPDKRTPEVPEPGLEEPNDPGND